MWTLIFYNRNKKIVFVIITETIPLKNQKKYLTFVTNFFLPVYSCKYKKIEVQSISSNNLTSHCVWGRTMDIDKHRLLQNKNMRKENNNKNLWHCEGELRIRTNS